MKKPTMLEAARQSEAFAKAAMEKAKETFRLAHSAYDAIGVTVAQLEAEEEEKTREAAEVIAGTFQIVQTCDDWIAFCRQIRWPEDSLAHLENLWWQHHNAEENLVEQLAT